MTHRIRRLAGIAALMAGFAAVTPAIADHGGGGWHGGGHGGGWHHGGGYDGGWGWGLFGLGLGLALTAPYYAQPYYPPAYYPPAYYPSQQVIVPAPAYVEQSDEYVPPAPRYVPQPAAAEGNNWWYHCRKPDGYYPYVSRCPGGWQKVSPTPAD